MAAALPALRSAGGAQPRPGARTDERTRHPPFLRSSSSTTWMDSSGSFPGRGLRRRGRRRGAGARGARAAGARAPGPKDTLEAVVGEERNVLSLPYRHGGQPVLLAVRDRQRAPGRELLLPRLAVGLQPEGSDQHGGGGAPAPPARAPRPASPSPGPRPGRAHVKKGGKLYCQGHAKLIAAPASAATGTAATAFRPAPLPARPRATPPQQGPPSRGATPSPRYTTPFYGHAPLLAPPPRTAAVRVLVPGAGPGSLRQGTAGRPVPEGRLRWELVRAGAVERSGDRRTSARRGGRSV